jgi:hypothetical protein
MSNRIVYGVHKRYVGERRICTSANECECELACEGEGECEWAGAPAGAGAVTLWPLLSLLPFPPWQHGVGGL